MNKKNQNDIDHINTSQITTFEQKDEDFSRVGLYRHSKTGRKHRVLGVARSSETLEKYVVYEGLYINKKFGENALWIRPYEMFFEDVEIDGKRVPRFEKIDEEK
mgnify:CR=1 FL=1